MLGADLPRNLLAPAAANSKGYWESRDLVNLHDEALKSMDLSWDDPRGTSSEWFSSSMAEDFRRRLEEALLRDFGNSKRFVVKDPRLCRLVPLWIPVLRAISTAPKFVFVIRNPLEVAASLEERDGIPLAQSLLLWLRHLVEAESATRPFPRVFVNYEELLEDWRPVLDEISTKLDLGWPLDSQTLEAEIGQFLSHSDRHHRISAAELQARQDIPSWVRRMYGVVTDKAVGRRELSDVFDAVGSEIAAADRAFGGILTGLVTDEIKSARRELLSTQVRAQELAARVRDLEHSASWRLTEPLRAVAGWVLKLGRR
jgi:hypothetical protein